MARGRFSTRLNRRSRALVRGGGDPRARIVARSGDRATAAGTNEELLRPFSHHRQRSLNRRQPRKRRSKGSPAPARSPWYRLPQLTPFPPVQACVPGVINFENLTGQNREVILRRSLSGRTRGGSEVDCDQRCRIGESLPQSTPDPAQCARSVNFEVQGRIQATLPLAAR
jgi:hypothetical protein